MSFEKRTYDEIRDSILAHITKGIVNEKHQFLGNQVIYSLENSPVKEIVKVEGLSDGVSVTFIKEQDYRMVENALEWIPGGNTPDNQSMFYVNYSLMDPPAVTDVNPGSVVRTLVEAFSREIDFLYYQLKHVYDAGFIDSASGSSLDLVTSILGVDRKPPEPATGYITFGRNTDPGEIIVEHEAHQYDGKTSYSLNNSPVKSITKIDGTLNGETHEFELDTDCNLSGNSLEWIETGQKPDQNTSFYVDYITFERIMIPKDSTVSTYARRSEDEKAFVTTEERELSLTENGRWEALVPIKAVTPGKSGNVFAGTLVVMPQPLVGVEYVINREDILTGVDVETDEDLRERAKHALEVAGKATLASLDSAVTGVEGVTSVRIQDMPDRVNGIVKIIVQGGDPDEINEVIENTRAAGIQVEFARPKIVNIDVSITVKLEDNIISSNASTLVEEKIRSHISKLDIGESLIFNRLIAIALSVHGVYDVENLTIKITREDGIEDTSSNMNITINDEEMAMVREVAVLTRAIDIRGG